MCRYINTILYPGSCSGQQAAAVRCLPQSRSACGAGAAAALGSCYNVVDTPRTFPDAQAECQKLGGSLLEVAGPLENTVVGMLVERRGAGGGQQQLYWTGGVINVITALGPGSRVRFWHGSQQPMLFSNNISLGPELDRPVGVALSRLLLAAAPQPKWTTVDFDTPLPFICKSKNIFSA